MRGEFGVGNARHSEFTKRGDLEEGGGQRAKRVASLRSGRPVGIGPFEPDGHRLVVGGCLEHAPGRLLPRFKSVTCLLEFLDRLPRRGIGREQSVDIPWVHDLPFEVEVEIGADVSCDRGEISIGEVLLA